MSRFSGPQQPVPGMARSPRNKGVMAAWRKALREQAEKRQRDYRAKVGRLAKEAGQCS